MSLYGVLRTGVSGMSAQGTKLSTVADNIANVNTTGYKRASTEFSTMVVNSGGQRTSYTPGGVSTNIRYAISEPGQTLFTNSATDLAIKGSGFFVVQDEGGTPYLTRAGSFVPNDVGELVNAGGFKLMGYNLAGGPPTPVANSLAGLEVVNVYAMGMQSTPSTAGTFAANLDSNLAVGGTKQSSLSVYDNLGNERILDIAFTKTGANTWNYTITDRATAAVLTGPAAMTFSPANGQLTSAPVTPAFTIPGGQPFTLDFTGMTQLGSSDFVPDADANGNAPSAVDSVEISEDGVVYAIFENGDRMATYQLALADVPSPDNLTPLAGNVFALSQNSGDVQVGFPGAASFGTVHSGSLEQSNVDMAAELTSMIEAQRGYTANSKVFQTGSDLLDVLVNLKR